MRKTFENILKKPGYCLTIAANQVKKYWKPENIKKIKRFL
jgi:hypothetical protein